MTRKGCPDKDRSRIRLMKYKLDTTFFEKLRVLT